MTWWHNCLSLCVLWFPGSGEEWSGRWGRRLVQCRQQFHQQLPLLVAILYDVCDIYILYPLCPAYLATPFQHSITKPDYNPTPTPGKFSNAISNSSLQCLSLLYLIIILTLWKHHSIFALLAVALNLIFQFCVCELGTLYDCRLSCFKNAFSLHFVINFFDQSIS